MRVLVPLNAIFELRVKSIKQNWTTIESRVVDMIRKVSKGNLEVIRAVKVLVTTIRPMECVVNCTYSLLQTGKLLNLSQRFRSPVKLEKSFKDIILFKIALDAGGGSSKAIISPINVEKPQSLNHAKPINEYTGNDYPENLHAEAFEETSPI